MRLERFGAWSAAHLIRQSHFNVGLNSQSTSAEYGPKEAERGRPAAQAGLSVKILVRKCLSLTDASFGRTKFISQAVLGS